MLEKITNKTCVYKIRANRSSYVSEEDYKCMNCEELKYNSCDKYKSIEKTQIPIRRGILAMINEANISRNN